MKKLAFGLLFLATSSWAGLIENSGGGAASTVISPGLGISTTTSSGQVVVTLQPNSTNYIQNTTSAQTATENITSAQSVTGTFANTASGSTAKGISSQASGATTNFGIVGQTSGNTTTNYGVYGDLTNFTSGTNNYAMGSNVAMPNNASLQAWGGVFNVSAAGQTSGTQMATGVNGTADSAYTNMGGRFAASGGTNNYGVYLVNAPLNIQPQAAPTGNTSGDIWHDNTQSAFEMNVASVTQAVNGTLWTMTVSSSVNTTAVENAIVSSSITVQAGIGTTIFPKNFFTPGKTVYVVLIGTYTDTTTPTLDIRAYLAGTKIMDSGAVTQVAVTGVDAFMLKLMITCRTTGASGTVMASGQTDQNTNTLGTTGMDLNSTLTTIDTTASLPLSITIQWGTSSASNNLTFTNGFVEVHN